MPDNNRACRTYIAEILLRRFLGIQFEIEWATSQEGSISIHGQGKTLRTLDLFLSKPHMPSLPLTRLELPTDVQGNVSRYFDLPLVFAKSSRMDRNENEIHFDFDLFGSAFFLLSRYEESQSSKCDEHNRFPASVSIAFKENFLDRALVNEYANLLRFFMNALWPDLPFKKHTFKVHSTHDVDIAYYFRDRSSFRIAKNIASEFFSEKSPLQIFKRSRQWIFGKDPFDTFDWMMDQADEADCKITFNILCGGKTQFDAAASESVLRELIQKIKIRGHRIGFHPSYETYDDEEIWKTEWTKLKTLAEDAPIEGGRQHYLRLRAPRTWRFWESAGFLYDSTLGYAEKPGFRSSTCFSYPLFDLENCRPLRLECRPLIFMDTSVKSTKYLALGFGQKSSAIIQNLQDECRFHGGEFTFLWHNSNLESEQAQANFRQALSGKSPTARA